MSDRFRYVGIVAGRDNLSIDDRDAIWAALDVIGQARAGLNPEPIIELLAIDCKYESQDVQKPLIGKRAVANYLRDRFKFFSSLRGQRDIGHFCRATVDLPEGENFPCLVFLADKARQAIWTIKLNTNGEFERINILLVAPTPDEAVLVDDYSAYKAH